jgi:hypothetical protein
MGVKGSKYFIQTGNVMENKSVDYVRDKIDYLNTLDKQQLRQYHKEQTKNGIPHPESKGAGLGLIEIARRTASKIEYELEPMDNELLYFTMYVAI